MQPLQGRITQYLSIRRSEDGVLSAFLVNPEYNLGRGISYDVALQGDAVVLTKPKHKGWALNGRFDDETGQLHIDWQGIGVFAFTRRDRDSAIGYYANTPAGSQRAYRVPVAAGDGWATASLGDVGVRVAPMLELQQRIESSDIPGPGDPQVHGMLVARHGKLVFETYLHGYSREQAHDTRSAGKSFASLLVSMAIEHGAKISAQTPVLSLLAPDKPIEHMDRDKRAITVGDLMSMRSGLACDVRSAQWLAVRPHRSQTGDGGAVGGVAAGDLSRVLVAGARAFRYRAVRHYRGADDRLDAVHRHRAGGGDRIVAGARALRRAGDDLCRGDLGVRRLHPVRGGMAHAADR